MNKVSFVILAIFYNKFIMKKLITTTIAATLILIMSVSANAATTFNDVASVHINKDAIEKLKTDKIIEGYSDSTYKPGNRINRAEFIKIIIASIVKEPTGSNCFKDVKDEWFAKYICTAKEMGYIKGYADGTFKPANYINFAEASKIITKSMDVKEDETDTNKEWFAGYVNGLAKKKAIPSTVHFFDKDITRGEMAETVWRVKENKTDKISQDYTAITQKFPAIQSCASLKEKFDAYEGFNSYRYATGSAFFDSPRAGGMVMEMDAATESAAPMMQKSTPTAASASSSSSSSGGSSEDFSSTNIQVEGVDEADIIKNDGKYIYMIKGNTVRIVEAHPTSNMKEIKKLDFTEKGFTPSEMYVNGDQLVIIGRSYYSYSGGGIEIAPMIYPPRPWRGNSVKVFVYNIKDRSNPTLDRKVSFDGNYKTSRRIGGQLYLVMNESPDVWIMNDVARGEDLIPTFQDGDKKAQSVAKCSDIHYFPGFVQPNYLIVASIPLGNSSGEIKSKVLLGSSDNVYSSTNNLFVATNKTSYDYYTDWDWRRDRVKTLVYKFALNDGTIEYKDRGEVPGRILNQFSMDEHKTNFRIATTIPSWDSEKPSSNNVFVMDKEMKVVGKIENIAPGERIYSTRFLGDRLYMVTFKQVDPLFVIDMKDPKNPKILGKLKIPGFSNYLHPYDVNHIIGFGKDTNETDKGRVTTTGFKMALFDVSDVTKPKQKFTENIGDKGTSSELLNNHKALLFDKEKNLLAFPIKIREKVNKSNLECGKYNYGTCPNLCQKRCIPTSCKKDASGIAVCTDDCSGLGSCTDRDYDQYDTTFSGAVVYTLNSNTGFNQRGRITHYSKEDTLKMGSYWPYDYKKNIKRIIYIGKNLFTISESKVKANDMVTVKDVNEVTID
mgnify:CR=1 FL=1